MGRGRARGQASLPAADAPSALSRFPIPACSLEARGVSFLCFKVGNYLCKLVLVLKRSFNWPHNGLIFFLKSKTGTGLFWSFQES